MISYSIFVDSFLVFFFLSYSKKLRIIQWIKIWTQLFTVELQILKTQYMLNIGNSSYFRVPYGCQSEIVIPVVDADDDVVKCRWSTGSECVSICGALPNATIDSVSCVFNDTFKLLLHVNVFRIIILRRNHCRKRAAYITLILANYIPGKCTGI